MNNKRQIIIATVLASISFMASANESVTSDKFTVSAATVEAAIAAPTVVAEQKKNTTVLVSPRTGMRYTLNNPSNLPIIFQTEALAPVTAQNVQRISATNPALSQASQEQAQQTLLQMESVGPSAVAQ